MTDVNPATFGRIDTTASYEARHGRPGFFSSGDSGDEPVNAWNPGIPSPSIFTNSRLAARVVPRVPIRLQQSGESQQGPQKIDPRSVRFTEIVEQVINGLATSGGIYKTNDGWAISYVPRQVTNTEAFQGEIFFSLTTNRLAFKDNDQVVHDLY